MRLPEPECPLGYPESQLQKILGKAALFNIFCNWMRGQTMGLCDGLRWNPDADWYDQNWTPRRGCYEPSDCYDSPHGGVVYRSDLERWMAGLPVVD